MTSEICSGERCWEVEESSWGYLSRLKQGVGILPLPQQKETLERGVQAGEEHSDALLV